MMGGKEIQVIQDMQVVEVAVQVVLGEMPQITTLPEPAELELI
jgi:hypothetical protein